MKQPPGPHSDHFQLLTSDYRVQILPLPRFSVWPHSDLVKYEREHIWSQIRQTALAGLGYKLTCLHLDFYFHSKWFDARLNLIGGTQAVNWRPTPINFNTPMTPAQVHISEPSYQAHCLFFSLALKALLLILWPNYTSSLWLTRPITQKCYSTKQYGAAAHFEAMQLSAEIIVDEEIDKIQWFFYMQCIKIFRKQTHAMFSMVYSMHIKPLHAQVDRQTFAITYCMACICKYTFIFLIAKDTIQTIQASLLQFNA